MLSDPDKRAAYDRYGHAAFNGGGGGNPFTGGGFAERRPRRHLRRSLRRDVQHGRQRQPQASRVQRGRDLRYDMTPRIRRGRLRHRERDHHPPHAETCNDCKGTGAAKGKAARDLPAVRRPRPAALPAGLLLRRAHLPVCGGTGTLDRRSLHDLPRRSPRAARAQDPRQGSRRRREGHPHPLLRAKARPASWAAQQAISTSCSNVKAHKFFERDGDDLHCVMPISFPQAALGTELEIQTLEGPSNHQGPRRHAERQGVQAARQGRSAPERPRQGRPHRRDPRADSGQAQRAQKELAAPAQRNDDRRKHADFARPLRESEGDLQLASLLMTGEGICLKGAASGAASR